MRLEPLYVISFRYHRTWKVPLGEELHQLLEGEGRCEGRIAGRFHGTNKARRRVDGTFEPDYQGVIETDDGAAILWHLTGYGFPDQGQVTATVKHLCDDERYRRLNQVLCAVNGELGSVDAGKEIRLEVAELVWEPIRFEA